MDALEQMDLNVWAAKAFRDACDHLELNDMVDRIMLLDDGFAFVTDGWIPAVVIVDKDRVFEFVEVDPTRFTRMDAINAYHEGTGREFRSVEHLAEHLYGVLVAPWEKAA